MKTALAWASTPPPWFTMALSSSGSRGLPLGRV